MLPLFLLLLVVRIYSCEKEVVDVRRKKKEDRKWGGCEVECKKGGGSGRKKEDVRKRKKEDRKGRKRSEGSHGFKVLFGRVILLGRVVFV